MTTDLFHPLPGSRMHRRHVHNVRVLDVRAADEGYELLTVETAGMKHEIIGGGQCSDLSAKKIGRWGYLVPAFSAQGDLPAGAAWFRDYADQSLRRVPELDRSEVPSHDEHGRASHSVAWCCEAKPDGFRAPPGIIPGENGRFVADETIAVTVRVPPEFVREATRVQRSPEEVLRGFVGDLAGVQNFVICPRADHYGSNGSDERQYAENWLDRAYGMDAIDVDEWEARREEDQDRQLERDDFASLLDEFRSNGGKPEDLFSAVQALVDAQTQPQKDNE